MNWHWRGTEFFEGHNMNECYSSHKALIVSSNTFSERPGILAEPIFFSEAPLLPKRLERTTCQYEQRKIS